MAEVNLSPYTIEAQQIEQRRKMAELLSQQANQPMGDTQMAGGWAIRQSPFAGLAKVLQSYNGRVGQDNAMKEMMALGQRQQSDRTSDMARILAGVKGTPATSETIMDETANGGEGAFGQINAPARPPGITPDLISSLKSPDMQTAALGMMTKAPIKLGKDETLLDPTTYQPLATGPKIPKFHVVGGNLVPEPTAPGAQVAPVFTAPEKAPEALRAVTEAMKLAGIDPASDHGKGILQNFVKTKTTHQQPNMQSVTVNTEKQLYGNIAESVGKDVATATANAKAAVSTLNTVGQIREALDSGKVVAGPGTTARVFLGQIGQVLGVAGKDATETLNKTRSAIQGMAQLELDAAQQMKGQGQITEAERGIIRRAASGDIDGMTVPELRTLTDTLDKTARSKIKANAANVARVKANPASASLADFMDVPEPAAYVPKRRSGDRGESVPAGVDPKIWGAMTPQEKALFK